MIGSDGSDRRARRRRARCSRRAGIAVTTGVLVDACDAREPAVLHLGDARPPGVHAQGGDHARRQDRDGRRRVASGSPASAARADVHAPARHARRRARRHRHRARRRSAADRAAAAARAIRSASSLDSQLRTPATRAAAAGDAAAHDHRAAPTRRPRARRALVARGAEVWRFPRARRPRRSRARSRARLGDAGHHVGARRGRRRGPRVAPRGRLADQVVLYVAPKVVGGPAPSWVGGTGVGDARRRAHRSSPFDGAPATTSVGDLRADRHGRRCAAQSLSADDRRLDDPWYTSGRCSPGSSKTSAPSSRADRRSDALVLAIRPARDRRSPSSRSASRSATTARA